MAEPLTQEDKKQIDKSLKAIRDAKQLFTRAKQAGMDVEELEKEANRLEQRLQATRQAFFGAE